MIRSMTGYGAAQHGEDGISYALEIRSVNSRYLKLSINVPDHFQFVEPALEKTIRARVSRGAVSCALRTRNERGGDEPELNVDVLQRYVEQFSKVRLPAHLQGTLDLGALLSLPGVCQMPEDDSDTQARLALVCNLAGKALDALQTMRVEEGRALFVDLDGACSSIRVQLEVINKRVPTVVQEYHERLRMRVGLLMKEGGFELEADSLAREVAIYAERCDISEELTRLNAHLDQFVETCKRDEPMGRTLDFLAQEMLREANTIASKSNDAAIAMAVVEVKGLIDRLKEQVQNVE